MAQQSTHNLAGYWSGIHTALEGRLLSVKDALKHPSSGLNAENYFRDLLRDYLPKRYAIEPGFVVNAAGERSDFMDALIVDALNIAPLSAEPYYKVFPCEAVVGAVEITSAPGAKAKRSGITGTIPKFTDDLLKLARLREIGKRREYIEAVPPSAEQSALSERRVSYELSPRCFLITCGDEWSKHSTYEKNLLAGLNLAVQHGSNVWVNAVLSLRHGMFHFRPFTQFTVAHFKHNALLEFILFLNSAVPGVRTGRIDVTRYRPSIPSESA